jgi:hypothetical protein
MPGALQWHPAPDGDEMDRPLRLQVHEGEWISTILPRKPVEFRQFYPLEHQNCSENRQKWRHLQNSVEGRTFLPASITNPEVNIA